MLTLCAQCLSEDDHAHSVLCQTVSGKWKGFSRHVARYGVGMALQSTCAEAIQEMLSQARNPPVVTSSLQPAGRAAALLGYAPSLSGAN